MAENLNNIGREVLETATTLVGGVLGGVGSLISNTPDIPNPEDLVPDVPEVPDVPNPEDLVPDVPEVPEVPDLKGLIGGLPLPSFRKPQPVKVEKPPEPRKLQKTSKIPNVPKKPELPKLPTSPNPPGIPPEYRRVVGGDLLKYMNELGAVAYAKDVGFGQSEIYRVEKVAGKDVITGPYITSTKAQF